MAACCARDNLSSFIGSSKRSIGVSSPPLETAIFAAGLATTWSYVGEFSMASGWTSSFSLLNLCILLDRP